VRFNSKVRYAQNYIARIGLVTVIYRHVMRGGDVTRTEEYWLIAAECERSADQLQDPSAKECMLAMARVWRSMAEQVERSEGDRKLN
jgi:hypothetical protein